MVSFRAPSFLVPYVEVNHVCFVDSYVVIAAECGLDLGRPVLEAPRTESTDRGGSIFGLCTLGGIHNDLSCLVVPSLRDFALPPPYSISTSCCPLSCLSIWQQKQKESSDDDDDTTSFNSKSFHGALVCIRQYLLSASPKAQVKGPPMKRMTDGMSRSWRCGRGHTIPTPPCKIFYHNVVSGRKSSD
jgi:hypothetical protein